MNYEALMKELEDIIFKLEDGDTKFDDATKLFERGAELCKILNRNLEESKGRVTVIREELGAILEEDLQKSTTNV